jgi:hypothetical protein
MALLSSFLFFFFFFFLCCLDFVHPKEEKKGDRKTTATQKKKERKNRNRRSLCVCVCDGGACLWVFVCVSVSVSENRFLFSLFFTSLFICGTRLCLCVGQSQRVGWGDRRTFVVVGWDRRK